MVLWLGEALPRERELAGVVERCGLGHWRMLTLGGFVEDEEELVSKGQNGRRGISILSGQYEMGLQA